METNTNDANDVTQLLRRAGARACPQCGAQSLIPAQDSDSVVWFCFDCGYYTSTVDASLKKDE
jgi:Zn ribbon nucleic-acid-binding protein